MGSRQLRQVGVSHLPVPKQSTRRNPQIVDGIWQKAMPWNLLNLRQQVPRCRCGVHQALLQQKAQQRTLRDGTRSRLKLRTKEPPMCRFMELVVGYDRGDQDGAIQQNDHGSSSNARTSSLV